MDKAGLARDTVFAAVMIICNGLVGLCLLAGGVRHHEQGFGVRVAEEQRGNPIRLGRLCGKPCQQGFRALNHSARGFRLQFRGRGTRRKAVPRTAGKHMYFNYFLARPV